MIPARDDVEMNVGGHRIEVRPQLVGCSKCIALALNDQQWNRDRREVRDRLREARAAGALVEEFRARALPAAERAGVEVARALDSRKIDGLEALSLEERRDAARVKFLRLVRDYRTALAELRTAVGGPISAAGPAARR